MALPSKDSIKGSLFSHSTSNIIYKEIFCALNIYFKKPDKKGRENLTNGRKLMRDSEFKVAKLNSDQFSKLKELENRLGVSLIAFEKKYSLAQLSENNLELVKSFEEETGLTLVAYKKEE